MSRPRVDAAVLASVAALAFSLSLGLTGCTSSSDTIAAQARMGDRKGFVSGDGTIERIALDRRGTPIALSGTTFAGKPWKVADERGRVVVLNVWGSWCGPCVAEAADLQKAWVRLRAAKKPVQFMGIDYHESRDNGAAFVAANRIGYPSLTDEDGTALLALGGKAPTTPATLVLDTQGRLAARVLGPVTTATLTGLVGDVVAETPLVKS